MLLFLTQACKNINCESRTGAENSLYLFEYNEAQLNSRVDDLLNEIAEDRDIFQLENYGHFVNSYLGTCVGGEEHVFKSHFLGDWSIQGDEFELSVRFEIDSILKEYEDYDSVETIVPVELIKEKAADIWTDGCVRQEKLDFLNTLDDHYVIPYLCNVKIVLGVKYKGSEARDSFVHPDIFVFERTNDKVPQAHKGKLSLASQKLPLLTNPPFQRVLSPVEGLPPHERHPRHLIPHRPQRFYRDLRIPARPPIVPLLRKNY